MAKGTLHEPVMKAKLKAAELRVVDTPAARELRAADALLPGHARVRRNLDAVERYLERTRPR